MSKRIRNPSQQDMVARRRGENFLLMTNFAPSTYMAEFKSRRRRSNRGIRFHKLLYCSRPFVTSHRRLLEDLQAPIESSYIDGGLRVYWSAHEKEVFFRALARWGKGNIARIAEAVGKSEISVKMYIEVLEAASQTHQSKCISLAVGGIDSHFPRRAPCTDGSGSR